MQKLNISVLLVALTSAVALTACNSGTSSSPAPTPTPVPTPTPSPTPTPVPPTPTPTPVPGESGVYALAGSGINVTYSTTPSTNAWTNFTSGTTQPFVAGVASESAAILFDRATNSDIVAAAGTATVNYNIYATKGAQVASAGTSIPVAVTSTNGAAASTIVLPNLGVNQVASNGSSAVVAAPNAITVNTTGPVTTAATYSLYSVSSTGAVTAVAGFHNLSGTYVALGASATLPVVKFINGKYYAYSVTGVTTLGNVLYSDDGLTWQEAAVTGAAAGSGITNVVQVSGSVYAAQVGTAVYLGSSPYVFSATAIIPTVTTPGFIAANGTGNLYLSASGSTAAGNFSIYTPTSTVLGTAVSTNTAAFNTTLTGLVFAGSNIYSTTAAATLAPIVVSGSNVTQAAAASIVSSTNVVIPLVANRYIAMGSNVLALNATTSTLSNTGEIANISAVAASNGAATYNNLPTGSGAVATGFAGTTSGYMVAVNNGDVLVSSSAGFVQAATVINPDGFGAALSQLVSAGGTYLASDVDDPSTPTAGNLYYSANNGTTWATITPTEFGNSASALSINASANGLYFINVTGGTASGTYQTATPQTLSTWVKINALPPSVTYNYWGGQYYQLTDASTNVGVYKTTTNQTTIYSNVLPQNAVNIAGTYNVAYNGSSYALAQVDSNYLWTSADLIGGIAGWTQNTAAFTGVNGATLSSETFLGPLMWTGKVWVATGAAGNVYTATAPTTFTVGTYTSTTGATTVVNGGTASGLF